MSDGLIEARRKLGARTVYIVEVGMVYQVTVSDLPEWDVFMAALEAAPTESDGLATVTKEQRGVCEQREFHDGSKPHHKVWTCVDYRPAPAGPAQAREELLRRLAKKLPDGVVHMNKDKIIAIFAQVVAETREAAPAPAPAAERPAYFDLLHRYQRLHAALRSIEANTCCDGCGEAARVARAALAAQEATE